MKIKIHHHLTYAKFHFQIYILFILLTSGVSISAQLLSPFVVSSSGGFYNNSAGMLSFTTGELSMVETFVSSGNILTQGFQQSWDFDTAIEESPDAKFSINIYPNPSDGNFNLMTTSEKQVDISMNIISILGVEIFRENFYQEEITSIHPFQLSTVPQGLYLIMVSAKDKIKGKEYQFMTKIHIVR
ncbi:MAG: T9SS type A sorting domain-containing protein [Saprospiraceae bacterium]